MLLVEAETRSASTYSAGNMPGAHDDADEYDMVQAESTDSELAEGAALHRQRRERRASMGRTPKRPASSAPGSSSPCGSSEETMSDEVPTEQPSDSSGGAEPVVEEVRAPCSRASRPPGHAQCIQAG